MLDWLQWPAMAATLVAAWLVASQRRARRLAGFALFVVSNALWIVWAVPAGAYALVVLQIGLFVLNVRGIRKNDPDASARSAS
jgi:glucose dehydrogenase